MVRNKASPKILIKISLLIFLFYKLKVIPKEKILKLLNKILKKNEEIEPIFHKLEELGLPIEIRKKKRSRNWKNWKKIIINIALKMINKKTGNKSDQEDEELIRDILKEVEKLGKN